MAHTPRRTHPPDGSFSHRWCYRFITRFVTSNCWIAFASLPLYSNGMTEAQDQAHFTMWCMLASPLIAGNDLTNMSASTQRILTNKYAIAVNQDARGQQARLVSSDASTQAWVKDLASPAGAIAVALINRGVDPAKVTLNLSDFEATAYDGFDVWAAQSIGAVSGSISANLQGTSAAFYTLTPKAYVE